MNVLKIEPLQFWKYTTLGLLGLACFLGTVALRSIFSEPNAPESPQDEVAQLDDAKDRRPVSGDKRIGDFNSPSIAPDERIELSVDPNLDRESFLKRGDSFLRAGNLVLAQSCYELFEKNNSDVNASFHLRRGLCDELQGDLGGASNRYRTVISSNETSRSHRILAATGLARVMFANGKTAEAKDLAADHLLQRKKFAGVPDDSIALLQYVWATMLEADSITERLKPSVANDPSEAQDDIPIRTFEIQQQGFLARPKLKEFESTTSAKPKRKQRVEADDQNSLVAPTSMAILKETPKPEVILPLIDQPLSPIPLQESEYAGTIELIQRPTSDADTILMKASNRFQSINATLAELSAITELEFRISDEARQTIAGRSRSLSFSPTTLSTILDELLVPYDLVWYQKDNQVFVIEPDEYATLSPLRRFRTQAATRALRQFELAFPDNELRPTALLSRAVLVFYDTDLDSAANLFQELAQAHPKAEVQALMFFNVAKLNLIFNRIDESKELLYQALDQTFDPTIESAAYALLGRIHLSEGDLDRCILTSQRAITLAKNDTEKRFAALNLARAKLLSKDPFGANDAIFRNQTALDGSLNSHAVAAIIGTYSRSIGLSDQKGIERARGRLLQAVYGAEPKSLESFADCYIAGLAFRTFGLEQKALDKFQLALARPDVGFWHRKISYELATSHEKVGNEEDAIKIFERLSNEPDTWAIHSMERLATLYAKTEKYDDCIDVCTRLLAFDLKENQVKFVLETMGNVFDKRGEHHNAALCFGGMLPTTIKK